MPRAKSYGRASPCTMSDADRERALRDNALDIELYEFAEGVARRHAAKYGGLGESLSP